MQKPAGVENRAGISALLYAVVEENIKTINHQEIRTAIAATKESGMRKKPHPPISMNAFQFYTTASRTNMRESNLHDPFLFCCRIDGLKPLKLVQEKQKFAGFTNIIS